MRRPIPVWVSVALITALAWPYWAWLYRLCASLHYNDFGKFYYGVLAWREGRSLYSLGPASFIASLPDPLTNLNPPHAMILVWPFTFLQVDGAFVAWMVLNGACLVGVTVMVCRTVGWRPTLRQVAVLLAGAPTATWLVTGQISGLLAVPLMLAWRTWRTGHLRSAGVWLGVAVSVKPFLGLFLLWMLWRHERRALEGAACSMAAVFSCGLLMFGVTGLADWLAAMRAMSWPWSAMNASVLGIVTRALTVTPYHVPIAVWPALVAPIWLSTVAGISVLLVRRVRRAASIDESWGLLMMAALLISPLGWTYYLWWVLPGLRDLTSRATSLLLLLPLPVVALTLFPSASPWLSFTVGSAYGWALLGGFLVARPAGSDG